MSFLHYEFGDMKSIMLLIYLSFSLYFKILMLCSILKNKINIVFQSYKSSNFHLLYVFKKFHQVTVTERAGHAFDVMASMTNRELSSYDGVVAVVSIFSFFLCRTEFKSLI